MAHMSCNAGFSYHFQYLSLNSIRFSLHLGIYLKYNGNLVSFLPNFISLFSSCHVVLVSPSSETQKCADCFSDHLFSRECFYNLISNYTNFVGFWSIFFIRLNNLPSILTLLRDLSIRKYCILSDSFSSFLIH